MLSKLRVINRSHSTSHSPYVIPALPVYLLYCTTYCTFFAQFFFVVRVCLHNDSSSYALQAGAVRCTHTARGMHDYAADVLVLCWWSTVCGPIYSTLEEGTALYKAPEIAAKTACHYIYKAATNKAPSLYKAPEFSVHYGALYRATYCIDMYSYELLLIVE